MSTTSPLIGQTLGDCVLLAELSGHAWSRCYLGERVQPDDQRTLVLLEHLPFLQVATPLAWQAFCQRVEAFQHLTHPALVQVIGCGLDPEQQPYLLGPYESLRSLETLVRRRLPRTFSLTQALNMVLQLGQVVHYLHQQGWWLGNIRPETIYLTAQGDLRLRLSSLEPLYASVKQEKINIPARQQQDQWALAALAYTLCTGKPLPSEAADGQTGKADRRSDVFVPREVISTLPQEVGRALLKALDPDPLRRYDSVLAFVLALNGRMTQQEGEERPRVRRFFGQHAGKMKSSAMSLESRPQARTAELVQERADSLLEKADMFSSTGAFASSSETRATLAEKEHLLPERDITPPALPWSAVLSSPVGATTAAFATVQHTAAHNQITSPITSSVSLGAPLGKRLQRSRRRVWKRLLLASSMLIFVAASAGGLWLALRNQGNGHIVGNTGKTLAQQATATAAALSSVPQLKVSFPCASPTACGFPDARSTGAPAEMHLTAQSGDIKVQQDGQTLSGFDLTGSLDVYANNVTISNCRISSTNWWGINLRQGYSGLKITHCTITGVAGKGIDEGGEDYGISNMSAGALEVAFNDISGFAQGISTGHGYLHDNYIHDLRSFPNASHPGTIIGTNDIISDGSDSQGLMIEHNTLLNALSAQQGAAAVIGLYSDNGIVSNATVERNWLAGGSYTIYGGGSGSSGIIVMANVFSTQYWPHTGYYGAVNDWNGTNASNRFASNYLANGTPFAMTAPVES